jgi:pyruvate dehydrogenase E1 component alpha subunit
MPACRAEVLRSGAASEADLQAWEQQIKGELDEALAFAADSPVPDLSEIDRDIYASGVSV